MRRIVSDEAIPNVHRLTHLGDCFAKKRLAMT